MVNDNNEVYDELDRTTRIDFDEIVRNADDYTDVAEAVRAYDGEGDRIDLLRAASALDESKINSNDVLGGLRHGRDSYITDLKALDNSRPGL